MSADGPVWVRANRHAVADAITNLVENGVAHSPSGGEVTVKIQPDGRVAVIDHGCGVMPQDREHIFDRFWRSRDLKAEGAGLGLAIVREIMKAHSGVVTLKITLAAAPFLLCRFRCMVIFTSTLRSSIRDRIIWQFDSALKASRFSSAVRADPHLRIRTSAK